MAGYLKELAEVRQMLDSRYDDLKSGHVKAVEGETAFAELRAQEPEASLSLMSEFVLHPGAVKDLEEIWSTSPLRISTRPN